MAAAVREARAMSDRRLDDDEMQTWLPTIRFVQLLPQVLDLSLIHI